MVAGQSAPLVATLSQEQVVAARVIDIPIRLRIDETRRYPKDAARYGAVRLAATVATCEGVPAATM